MRLFIAISPTEEIRKALVQTQDALFAEDVEGNYLPEENLHMTLSFIGEHPDADQVLDAMDEVAFESFPITLKDIGVFNNDVLWAGIQKSEALEQLVKRIRYSLAKADIPFDRRNFCPHFTLIRNTDYEKGLPNVYCPETSMIVDRITLFRSDRGKSRMIYTEIGSVESETKKGGVKDVD